MIQPLFDWRLVSNPHLLIGQATRLSGDVEEVDRFILSRLTQGTLLLENIDNSHTSIQGRSTTITRIKTSSSCVYAANR